MPSAVPVNGFSHHRGNGITKFTNCLLVRGNDLVQEDLWISSVSGKILNGQEILYEERTAPDNIVDLGGKILSPGLIDVQLNGAFGFNFSTLLDEDSVYKKSIEDVNLRLVQTGVTSYMPTVTSQEPLLYNKVSHVQQTINNTITY